MSVNLLQLKLQIEFGKIESQKHHEDSAISAILVYLRWDIYMRNIFIYYITWELFFQKDNIDFWKENINAEKIFQLSWHIQREVGKKQTTIEKQKWLSSYVCHI